MLVSLSSRICVTGSSASKCIFLPMWQIAGRVLAVKKALLAVSRRLQERILVEGAPGHISTHGASHNPHTDSSLKNSSSGQSISDNAVEHFSVDHTLSVDVEKKLNIDDKSSLRKVLFRFLCSNVVAGGVIGKGAHIVKSLEKETGASIKFGSPVSGSKERVAIISSLEVSYFAIIFVLFR